MMLALVPATSAPGEDDWVPERTVTWTPEDGPVVLNASLTLDETTRLVIEAGVEVRLDILVGIQIKGHLDVRGTAGEPVLFTANTSGPIGPDSWESVRLMSESAGRLHRLEHAVFQGARTGLQVSSTAAMVQDCEFMGNRYGIVARSGAHVEVRASNFVNNSALGLEWEEGSTGMAVDCHFQDNVVGVYMYKVTGPQVVSCTFEANYHHVSFANRSNGTVRSCTFRGATGEAYECYGGSAPLLVDVTFEQQEDDGIHIREASRPMMVGGTPVSNLVVDSKDEASYVVAMAWITVEVRKDDGGGLPGANVTIEGASGANFTRGTTDGEGVLEDALMSLYTSSSSGGHDRENPHRVTVEWRGQEQTFVVDPRDLDNDRVLSLEMDIDPPEPGGWGFVPNVVILLVISLVAIAVAWWYTRRQ
jgi:hypothetical protein